MPRKKGHSGVVRGEVTHEKYSATVELESGEALNLIRHIAEALTYSDKIVVEPHWGRRGGENNLHRIDIWSG
jgi:hypothetical protein